MINKNKVVCFLLWLLIAIQLYAGFSSTKYENILMQITWCIIFLCGAIGIYRYNRLRCFYLAVLSLLEFKDELDKLNESLQINDTYIVTIVILAFELFIFWHKLKYVNHG